MSRSAGPAGRYADLQARIRQAASGAGRDPSGILLVGVTKTVPPEPIRQAVAAGLAHLGENRVQEAAGKIPLVGAGPIWHLIGHLQSNKARRAVELFDWIHSVDSADLVERIERAAGETGRRPSILIQVDLAGEATKHGAPPGQVEPIARLAAAKPHLQLAGLMTIPPLFDDPASSRPFFARLRALREDLAGRGLPLAHLSMGMTGDFEVAIEEGATLIRVGRALFGERS